MLDSFTGHPPTLLMRLEENVCFGLRAMVYLHTSVLGEKHSELWCCLVSVLSKYCHHGHFQAVMVSQQAHKSSNDVADVALASVNQNFQA